MIELNPIINYEVKNMSKFKKRDMERKGDKKQKIQENKLQEEPKTEVHLEELPEK